MLVATALKRRERKRLPNQEKTMQLPAEVVLEAALGLPENERLALASRLLETIPVDDAAMSLDDDSLLEELERRFADRAGEVDWSELRAER
jgi:hypothetical protein